MGHSIVMGTWETVLQIGGLAGFGSLALGVGNTVFNVRQAREKREQEKIKAEEEKAKPALTRQRELRERLRKVLIDVQRELKPLKRLLESGANPPDETPSIFMTFKDQTEALTLEGLASPSDTYLSEIRSALFFLPTYLRGTRNAVERLKRYYSQPSPDPEDIEIATKRMNAERSTLEKSVNSALEVFEKWLGLLAQMDDGDQKVIDRYKRF